MSRSNLRLPLLAVAVQLLCSVSVRAAQVDPGIEAVEEMIVSASRASKARSSVPSFSTVLDGNELEVGISPSLSDALRFVPGLHVVQEGARGGRTALYLRGLDPNHVIVLVDGVRLNDPTNSRGGSFDPTVLALVAIDRVEVIRGPQSSVYGSDALAGVINVITRKVRPDDEPTASLTVSGGRFHAGQAVAQASGGIGGYAGLSVGAAVETFRDPDSDGSFDGLSVKAKLNAELPGSIDFEAFARFHRSSARSFPQSSGGPELALLRRLEDRDVREIMVGASLERSILDDGARLSLRASRASRREDLDSPGIDNPGVVPPSHSGDEYVRWDLALTSDWRLPELEFAQLTLGSRIVVGADVVWEDGESDTFLDFGAGPTGFPFFDHRRTVGVFAEVEEAIGPWVVVSGSLRFDTTPDEQDRLSPALGFTIEIPHTVLRVFGNYGEGFKRPSFFALGHPLVGDPSLRVERGRGWELGFRARSRDGRLAGQISYFDIEVENLIDFDDMAFVIRNRGRLVSRGIEAEASWRVLNWLRWRGSVTYNPTDFGGTSLQPENRPRWRGFGEILLVPTANIVVGLRALVVGSVKASAAQIGGRIVTLHGYERLDLRIGWTPREWLSVFFEIENLTDRSYREAVGFESPGIAPRLGITLRR